MVVVTHTCVSSSRVIVVAVIARLRPPVPQRAPPDGDDHDHDDDPNAICLSSMSMDDRDDGGSHVDGLEARHRECLGLSRVEKPTNHDQERSTPTPTTKERTYTGENHAHYGRDRRRPVAGRQSPVGHAPDWQTGRRKFFCSVRELGAWVGARA